MPRSYLLSKRGLRSLRATIRRNKPWTRSTGPRTPEGKAKVATNPLVHGERSVAITNFRRLVKLTIGELRSAKHEEFIEVQGIAERQIQGPTTPGR
jgi:hypothetical protein